MLWIYRIKKSISSCKKLSSLRCLCLINILLSESIWLQYMTWWLMNIVKWWMNVDQRLKCPLWRRRDSTVLYIRGNKFKRCNKQKETHISQIYTTFYCIMQFGHFHIPLFNWKKVMLISWKKCYLKYNKNILKEKRSN